MDQLHRASTEVTAIVPEVWSAKSFDVNVAKLPWLESVDQSWSGELASFGDTVNIYTVPEFDEAVNLAEGAAGNADAVTVTSQALVVNQRPYKDAIVTSKAQLQSISFMDDLRDKMIYAINKKIQAIIIAATVPSASSPDHQIGYDAGTTLALADILEAKELLDLQDVAEDGRIGIMGAMQINDLFLITGFMSRDFIPAGSPITSGKIQTPICGFMPKVTTVVGNTSRWFHPSYLSMIIQQSLNITVSSLAPLGIRGDRVNIDVLMGIKQLDDERVVSIS